MKFNSLALETLLIVAACLSTLIFVYIIMRLGRDARNARESSASEEEQVMNLYNETKSELKQLSQKSKGAD